MKNSPPGNRKENVKMESLDKIYEICIKHLEKYPSAIKYVPEQYLTEELCIAALKGTRNLDWDGEKIWEHIPMDKLTPKVCELLLAITSIRRSIFQTAAKHQRCSLKR